MNTSSVSSRFASFLTLLLGFVLFVTACEKPRQPLPTLGHVPPFELMDQGGKSFTPGKLEGRLWVAAFMFTRCPSVCPKITHAMKELQDRAKQEGISIHWVSFSVDPDNDTPAVLKAYAIKHQADLASWSFLTGPLQEIKQTAEDGFKLAFAGTPTEGAPHLGITHGSHLVLVDERMNIRGYYRTLDGDAQKRLLSDAKTL